LEHPVKLHQRSSPVPKWTEPSFWAGGPLSATQNAEPSTVTAFELHVLFEVVYAVVGGIPSRTLLDGAIIIPRGHDEYTTKGYPAGPVLLEEVVVHFPNGE